MLERASAAGTSDEVVEACLEKIAAEVRVHALKLLANRLDSPSFQAKWLAKIRGKLTDSDAFVSRAAAEALGQHPTPDNIKALLDAWSATPPVDSHRLHVVRMALRDQLLGIGFFAVANSLTTDSPGNWPKSPRSAWEFPKPTRPSSYWTTCRSYPRISLRKRLYWSMRRDIAGRAIIEAEQFAQRSQSRSPEDQLAVVRAVYRAMQARGTKPTDVIKTWQQRLVRALLASDRESQVQSGLEMARDLKLTGLHEQLTQLAAASAKFPNLRTAAIDACVANDATGSVALLGQILGESVEPMSLRQKAAQALGNINTEPARQQLLAMLKTGRAIGHRDCWRPGIECPRRRVAAGSRSRGKSSADGITRYGRR